MAEAISHPKRAIVEIRPSRGWLDLDLPSVWAYRSLMFHLVWRDVKVRYKQAVLGVGWAIIQPAFAVLIFSVVFGLFAKIPSEGVPYPAFAFAAILPWTYFAEALRRAGTGLVSDSELVRKIYFPRLIIPIAGVLSPLVDFAMALAVLLGVLAWYGIGFGWSLLLTPLFLLLAGGLALGVGLWLGPVNVRYRDVVHTLPFLIQVWMYASPIVYPLSLVPDEWRTLYSLNPMVGVIEGFRWAVLGHSQPNLPALLLSALVVLALLIGGLLFFRRSERSFADLI